MEETAEIRGTELHLMHTFSVFKDILFRSGPVPVVSSRVGRKSSVNGHLSVLLRLCSDSLPWSL